MTHNDLLVKDDIYKVAFTIFSEEVICGHLTKCGKREPTQGTRNSSFGDLPIQEQVEIWENY